MLSECLDDSSIRLGVPFIALRQLGAVGSQFGRPTCLLSGGALDSPVHHRTTTVVCPVHDFLPNRTEPTVTPSG
jgi:hypothetical protein